MKKFINSLILCNVFFGATALLAQETCVDSEIVHIVKKDETLSKILNDLNLRPMYGPNGAIKKTALVNNLENPDLIYQGQAIKITSINDRDCKSAQVNVSTTALDDFNQVSDVASTEDNLLPELSPPQPNRFYILGGVGLQSSSLKQKDDSDLESAKFASTTFSSWRILLGYKVNEKITVQASYISQSGSIVTPPNLIINQKSYQWTETKLEALYQLEKSIVDADIEISAGANLKEIPFLVGGTLNDVDVLMPRLMGINLGFESYRPFTETWAAAFNGRILVPLSSSVSGGSYSLRSGYEFQFELFAEYKIRDHLQIVFGPTFNYFQNSYSYRSSDDLVVRGGKTNLQGLNLQVNLRYHF